MAVGVKIVHFESGTLSFSSCAKRKYWRRMLLHLGMSGRHSVARIEGRWDSERTKNKQKSWNETKKADMKWRGVLGGSKKVDKKRMKIKEKEKRSWLL